MRRKTIGKGMFAMALGCCFYAASSESKESSATYVGSALIIMAIQNATYLLMTKDDAA